MSSVFVTNSGSSQAIPVTGSVNVGNFPSTQPVSGAVSVSNFPATQPVSGSVNVGGTVSVGNFPSTQTVTGSVRSSDQTTRLAHSEVAGEINGGGNNQVTLLGSTDTSAARTVRLDIGCLNAAISTCSTAHVLVLADNFVIDVFDIGNTGFASRTYDVPGTFLKVYALNTDTTELFETGLFGRGN